MNTFEYHNKRVLTPPRIFADTKKKVSLEDFLVRAVKPILNTQKRSCEIKSLDENCALVQYTDMPFIIENRGEHYLFQKPTIKIEVNRSDKGTSICEPQALLPYKHPLVFSSSGICFGAKKRKLWETEKIYFTNHKEDLPFARMIAKCAKTASKHLREGYAETFSDGRITNINPVRDLNKQNFMREYIRGQALASRR